MVFMPHWPQILGSRPIDLGLDRVKEALSRLGNPQEKLPPVVHVAGTNGKGSTIAFMRAFLEAAGYKVHVYTSPHLLDFNERIVVAGKPISDSDLYQIMEECRITIEGIPVTFFEGTTVGAFLAFSRTAADIVLLETGLGGRLDATNVVDKPALTVLTPISMDHTEYLGEDIRLIAGEKLGIVKEGVTCVSSLQMDVVAQKIADHCAKILAPLSAFGYDWGVEHRGKTFGFSSSHGTKELTMPKLLGAHQVINAATAIAAMEQLDGFVVDERALEKGLKKVDWPGRLQQVTKGTCAKQLSKGWELWLDGAHNEAAAHVLSNVVRENWNDKPTYIICGMTKGRDVGKFLQYFAGSVEQVYGVTVQSEPSSYAATAVVEAALQKNFNAKEANTVEEAVAKLCKNIGLPPGRILVCGSLYLATDVLKEPR